MRAGGHDAVHQDLGTIEDVKALTAAAKKHGIDIALDFAIQCSADHPWLHEHPDWFHRRPDGTLKYAENPPKRYQDIYNVNWESPDWKGLWDALLSVMLHWVDAGVTVFRVDNPHTKPFEFWRWLIENVHRAQPRRRVPRRGLHAQIGHAPPGQDRIQPVLHLLHLEELALRTDRVRLRAGPHRGERVLPPELLRQHPGHPARVPPARRPRRVRSPGHPRRHAQSELWHLFRLRELRERPGKARLRGVPALREIRDQAARARRPAAALHPAPEHHPA